MGACGGGGGGGSSSPVLPSGSSSSTTTSTSSSSSSSNTQSYDQLKAQFEDYEEYQDQYGLGLVNASSAYARGSTGSGIVIGVTDSGLDTSHVEIGSLKVASGSQLSYSNYTPNTRQKRHGTMVSGIAAGLRNGSNYGYSHGVAFDAEVFFVAIQLSEPDENYDPILSLIHI